MDKKNNKLGKGLSSLLGEKKYSMLSDSNIVNGAYLELDFEKIIINPNQPRRFFDEEKIEELSISIKNYGILEPIVVRRIEEERYEIVAGERRFRAAKKINLKNIPVIVKEYSDEEVYSLSIIENIQREDLNAIEEANAYKELMERYNHTQNDIGEKVGKSRSHIANLIRVLNLPISIQSCLIEGKISLGHAKILVGFEDNLEVIDYIVDQNLTVKETEKLIKEYSKDFLDRKNLNKNQTKSIANKELRIKIDKIKEKIELDCEAIYKENNSGFIKIKYKNLEDLDYLLTKIK